jgi:hypothetical protein
MFGRKKHESHVEIVEANLVWEVGQDPDSGLYIGVCRPLNLNELQAFLHRNHWKMLGEIVPGQSPVFDVPFEIRRTAVRELVGA